MRYLEEQIKADLQEKMVFLGGPRQVGKTTTALSLLAPAVKQNPAYLSWDSLKSKELLRKGNLPANEKLIVIDEIHKFRGWRDLVKGFYDHLFPETQFLITGSARLDHYRRGGDSMVGRFHYLRLHPLTLTEIDNTFSQEALQTLFSFGGFPEPYFKQSVRFHKRWQRERLSHVIQDDVRSLEKIEDLDKLELLVGALPERVGTPLSINALAKVLLTHPATIERWVRILENLYVAFRIPPYGSSRIKAVKKEQKLYLWDWSQITEPGARFENMLASFLLKYCHYLEDTEGDQMELRYLRDETGREVDFIVLKNRKPLFAIEAKYSAREISSHVNYFKERTAIPVFYQTHFEDGDALINAGTGVKQLPLRLLIRELGLL